MADIMADISLVSLEELSASDKSQTSHGLAPQAASVQEYADGKESGDRKGGSRLHPVLPLATRHSLGRKRKRLARAPLGLTSGNSFSYYPTLHPDLAVATVGPAVHAGD